MKTKINISAVKRIITSVFTGLIFYLALLILVTLLMVQVPQVQTFLAKETLALVSQKTKHNLSISTVQISWLDKALLRDITVYDRRRDTLIYASELEVNYKVLDLLNSDFFSLEELNANGLLVQLKKKDSLSELNVITFLESFGQDTVQQDSTRGRKNIVIESIEINDFEFSLDDNTRPLKNGQLDPSHLDFSIHDLQLLNFAIRSDTIQGDLNTFSGSEKKVDFAIEEFSTVFRLSNYSLSLDDLVLRTSRSFVSDSLEFFYNGLDDLGTFVDSVSFVLHLDNTFLHQKDLRILTGAKEIQSNIGIDGIFWGTVGDFNIEDARVDIGESSFFEGGISCFGLPKLDQTFALADFTRSRLDPSDLKPYIGNLEENLRQMGRIDFTGSFAGFLNDFVARGDFRTDQGSVHTDINLKIPEEFSEMSYVGNLRLDDVNVGAFIQNDVVQRVNLEASIDGTGISKENAHFDINALVTSSGILGYTYDTISIDGVFENSFYDGELAVIDPNCDFAGFAQIDFRNEYEIVDVGLEIVRLQLDSLNLSSSPLALRGKVDLEIQDVDLNQAVVKLALDSMLIEKDSAQVVLDSLRFAADFLNGDRRLSLDLPGVTANLEGEFLVTDLLSDFPIMVAAYEKKLQLIDTVEDVSISGSSYQANLDVKVYDISSYLDSLNIPIDLYGMTQLKGSFKQYETADLTVFLKTDSIKIGENRILNPLFEIKGSEKDLANKISTSFAFRSDRQVFSGVPPTQGLRIDGEWNNDQIDLSLVVDQPETNSDLLINSRAVLLQDSIQFSFLESSVFLFDDRWKFDEKNSLTVTGGSFVFENFGLANSEESISVSGSFSELLDTDIKAYVSSLGVEKANLFAEADLKGTLDGTFHVFKGVADESYKFDGAFSLEDFYVGDLLVGNIAGNSNWDPVAERIFSKVKVERKEVESIAVDGYYYPSRTSEQLDFGVQLENIDFSLAEPILKENISNISGSANGDLMISGTLDQPKINGDFEFVQVKALLNYLNTQYQYDGFVSLSPTEIGFRDFLLTDRKGANARLSGKMKHQSFDDIRADIQLVANKFEFLNTTSTQNESYYGSAYGTGTIKVTGPLSDLLIAADIKTETGTKFFIPISDGTSVSQEEYITFRGVNDSTLIAEVDDGITGLTLDFDLDITPDAYCELIFDIKTGDIIRGRGRGNLKLTLDTDGEFNMFGPLEITDGAYNFTVPNLISKEFDVSPGSRIVWYGDPYNASLEIDATYLQRASFEEYKAPEDQTQDIASTRVPVLVILKITGGLMSPNIDFDIQLQNPSDLTQEIEITLNSITENEQELKRQVTSLLFLKKFSAEESFFGGGGSFGSSVSEFLSNQVSYLVSQIDENLEVEVNLSDMNKEAFNTFQLRFAYTFLDGRLKVTRGGGFGSDDESEEADLDDIVGDWSVEYTLTNDGKLRAKVFRNSTQRIQSGTPMQGQETGISLRFVHSFNDLNDMLSLSRENGIEKKIQEADSKIQSDVESGR